CSRSRTSNRACATTSRRSETRTSSPTTSPSLARSMTYGAESYVRLSKA
ncbi:MAG: Carbonic anhydrase, beta class, partial [uncultured Rubrobacteraceae bacterium]